MFFNFGYVFSYDLNSFETYLMVSNVFLRDFYSLRTSLLTMFVLSHGNHWEAIGNHWEATGNHWETGLFKGFSYIKGV